MMFNKLTQLLAVFIFLADPVRPDLTNNKVTAVLNVTTQSGTNYDPISNDYKNSPYNNYKPYSSKPSPIDWNNQVKQSVLFYSFFKIKQIFE